MPNRIRVLPDEIANRIAAGEVVERPASVVKELVENAIDAGSDRIVVEVAAGGKETIRVSDNGCGMSRDDALLALERHATSKIFDLNDLRTLRTLGFRGEALPSIAAVSRLNLETRQEEDVEGTRIVVEGGRVRDVTSAGRGRGTSVTVHGLFFNVPARRKFLKATETELRHIVNAVTGLALAYAEISFVLSHNGREALNLDRGDRKRRIASIYGIRLGEDSIFVESGPGPIQVWGFVERPEMARKSGAQQSLVVNGRWVQHKGLAYAVNDGYGGLLPKGASPTFALFMEVDPARVDVNVHPSKREVRFADERSVYRVLAGAVRDALRAEDLVPDVASGGLGAFQAATPTFSAGQSSTQVPDADLVAEGPQKGRKQAYLSTPRGLDKQLQMALPLTVQRKEHLPRAAEKMSERELVDEGAAHVPVWQVHEAYIMAPIKNGLILLDQQAAHERVIYEQVLDRFQQAPGTGQRLLFPLTLDFGLREIQVVREAMPLLEKTGFGIRDFGGNTVVVDAIPLDLKTWEDGRVLREIVGDLLDREQQTTVPMGQDTPVSPLEHRLGLSYARHTAIRRGDSLSTREMQVLIDRLFATREPFVSPGGHTTVVKMSLDEIASRFGK